MRSNDYKRFYISRSVVISLICLGVLALITAVLQTYTLYEVRALDTSQQVVDRHAYTLDDITTNLLTAETGTRGFVITSNPSYLEPYTMSLPRLRHDTATLETFESTVGPTQAANFRTIVSLAQSELANLRHIVATVQSNGSPAATAIIQTNKSKSLMDSLRTVSARTEDRQNADLALQRAHTDTYLSYSLTLRLVLLVLIVITVVLAFYLSRRAIERVQALEKAKAEFIDIAAHQLRTPATSVKQYLGLMLGGYMGRITAKQRSVLETANHSNEQGLRIVEDILRVARADSGEMVLHPEPISLKALLQDIQANYQSVLDERHQTLEVKLPTKTMKVLADPSYIRLAFENLLDNASKYSSDSTIITIWAKQTVRTTSIGITDRGVGIAKKDQPKLFQKFSRIENERSAAVGGTGLGLYWVKRIIELHGGQMVVTSAAGKGSTFTITLPGVQNHP